MGALLARSRDMIAAATRDTAPSRPPRRRGINLGILGVFVISGLVIAVGVVVTRSASPTAVQTATASPLPVSNTPPTHTGAGTTAASPIAAAQWSGVIASTPICPTASSVAAWECTYLVAPTRTVNLTVTMTPSSVRANSCVNVWYGNLHSVGQRCGSGPLTLIIPSLIARQPGYFVSVRDQASPHGIPPGGAPWFFTLLSQAS